MFSEDALYLARFDPVSPDLDLIVKAPQELDPAVRQEARPVARPVQTAALRAAQRNVNEPP